eukprot:c12161_g1_i1.p1 GENE.c12161_g1_i1~~c12161_g1_i1.p1  ORF type:complete len:362 (-),score=56.45 c12161_g1_i1:5-1063(-)
MTHHMSYAGYRFLVTPNGFVTHNSHPKRLSLANDFYMDSESNVPQLRDAFLEQLDQKYKGTGPTKKCDFGGDSDEDHRSKPSPTPSPQIIDSVTRIAEGAELLPAVQATIRSPRFPRLPAVPSVACLAPHEPTLTLVTKTTERTLRALDNLCNTWPGDIVVGHTGSFDFSATEWSVSCASSTRVVQIVPVTGTHTENHVRNIAVDHTRTSHYLYLDLDYTPSPGLLPTLIHLLSNRSAPYSSPTHAIILEDSGAKDVSTNAPSLVECLAFSNREALPLVLQKCSFTPKYSEVFLHHSRTFLTYQAQYAGYEFSTLPGISFSNPVPELNATLLECSISRLVGIYGESPRVPVC